MKGHSGFYTLKLSPHSRDAWIRFLVFPIKSFVLISLASSIVLGFFPSLNTSTPNAAELFAELTARPLYACAAILMVAALLFAVFGPKGHAFLCVGFAAGAFFIAPSPI